MPETTLKWDSQCQYIFKCEIKRNNKIQHKGYSEFRKRKSLLEKSFRQFRRVVIRVHDPLFENVSSFSTHLFKERRMIDLFNKKVVPILKLQNSGSPYRCLGMLRHERKENGDIMNLFSISEIVKFHNEQSFVREGKLEKNWSWSLSNSKELEQLSCT